MADGTEKFFKNRRVDFLKLVEYGFTEKDGEFIFNKELAKSGFILTVKVCKNGKITALTMDPALGEPYELHLTSAATGSFVGGVRNEYEQALTDIAQKCFVPHVFKWQQTQRCIEYVGSKYGDELEFLWDKFPDNAIWRRKDNKKWYGVLLTVSAQKLGLKGGMLEIIDLKTEPTEKSTLIDNVNYFCGYHMNKNSWLTVVLDGRVKDSELFKRIDLSYMLASKK